MKIPFTYVRPHGGNGAQEARSVRTVGDNILKAMLLSSCTAMVYIRQEDELRDHTATSLQKKKLMTVVMMTELGGNTNSTNLWVREKNWLNLTKGCDDKTGSYCLDNPDGL